MPRSYHSSLLLFIPSVFICATSSLPSPPPSFHPLVLPTSTTNNATLSLPDPTAPYLAGSTLECFNLTSPETYPVEVEDCEFAIEAILHDTAGAMELNTFSYHPEPGGYEIPATWYVTVLRSLDSEIRFRVPTGGAKHSFQTPIPQCQPSPKDTETTTYLLIFPLSFTHPTHSPSPFPLTLTLYLSQGHQQLSDHPNLRQRNRHRHIPARRRHRQSAPSHRRMPGKIQETFGRNSVDRTWTAFLCGGEWTGRAD